MTNIRHVRQDASNRGRLENRLVLLGWLHSQLGYGSTAELLRDIREAEEGFTSDGRSYAYSRLTSRVLPERIRIKLTEYDANIRVHLNAVNAGRREPFTLKYFQYLAVLYAEIFLDHYFNHRLTLLTSLNEWVDRCNEQILPGGRAYEEFRETSLSKLAFWMATGSGKTLVMHLNYLQFMHYNSEPLDNILLVTPNEGLSNQHLRELRDSGISAARFDLRNDRLGMGLDSVQVIEITKLASEKRGEGASVPIDAFEGTNLILVDEGHKGSGGQAWRSVRDALGATGFTFEYSATFGQALTAAKDDELVEEYGKAIAFDYHYRHFYDDGYGKDFHIVNLREEPAGGRTDTLLLANLLSFYEQHLIFAEHGEDLRPYNVEKPLWVFVGSSVQSKPNRRMRSDILTVVHFLHRLLADRRWATETISHLLGGRSGLEDNDGNDIFHDKFRYLRDGQANTASTYTDILKRVLHADSPGGLHLYDIRSGDGELGLKAAGSKHYFGLINIGDDNQFKKQVESDSAGIVIEQDPLTPSLFDDINSPDTNVEILIGAKKFVEGWNSWRVSAMGLLNIGTSEGSQIIQLFGRGVRLRGLDMSLKRSSALTGIRPPPPYIRELEVLNIFALRANYMHQFRKDLEAEGAAVHGMVEINLPIRPNRELLGHGLVVPRLCEGASFSDNALVLGIDAGVDVKVNLSPKIDLMASGANGVMQTSVAPSDYKRIPDDSLDLVDMSDIYTELLEYKKITGWHNMIVRPDAPEMILRTGKYRIAADDSVLRPTSFDDVRHLQKAAAIVVTKYADRFYRMLKERWAPNRMSYQALDKGDHNFQDYTVEIPAEKEGLVSAVCNLVEEGDRIHREETDTLPNVHFDRHLYQPLLLARENDVRIYPPGLTEGEARFVRHLREYCADKKDTVLAGKEVFLLRNLGRGKGVGFFQTYGFYPDFILWVKSGTVQRIVFVEPHGMRQEDAPDHSEKVQLHRTIRELAGELGHRPGMADVTLDAYIVSETAFEDMAKRYGGDWNRRRFADECHILFPERGADYDYLEEIICENDL